MSDVLFLYLLLPVASYSLGAVPFGLILCLVVKGVDIREHGSRNIGATNAGRVCGFPFFVVAFVLDFGKGLAPVLAGGALARAYAPVAPVEWLVVLYGALAIVGHTFPAQLRFKGGKAVATGFGVLLGLAPVAAMVALGVWVLLFLAFRYVSFASIVAALSAPIAYAVQHRGELSGREPVLWFAVVMAVLVTARHHGNIRRLITGTEDQVTFGRKSD